MILNRKLVVIQIQNEYTFLLVNIYLLITTILMAITITYRYFPKLISLKSSMLTSDNNCLSVSYGSRLNYCNIYDEIWHKKYILTLEDGHWILFTTITNIKNARVKPSFSSISLQVKNLVIYYYQLILNRNFTGKRLDIILYFMFN